MLSKPPAWPARYSRRFWMFKKLKRLWLVALGFLAVATATGQSTNVLILYDASGSFGWYGNLHAKMLANLIGHFDLSCQIKPVESYSAGEMDQARATFYLGTVYDNPLPAGFTNDVLTTTNPICWFNYNLWQVSGTAPFPNAFNSKFGFRFLNLDVSGYSNIVYKGETFGKSQADPELGVVEILNPNLVSSPATAWKTNADNAAVSIPYVVQASNFWYVADSPFGFISEEDRYIAFADLLHDILGMDHPESHQAIIRLEDVTMRVYPTNALRAVADCLHSNNVPFGMAVIPVYRDPFGFYNSGAAEEHGLSDAADSVSVAMLDELRYAATNGGQILLHGYTHQYDSTENPYNGTTADDFEFWRETFHETNSAMIDLYEPVPEDSSAWAFNRVRSAINELQQAGLPWAGWETPHYAASAMDYQVFATNFPLTMQRILCFSEDFDSTNRHVVGQFFPYVIQRDIYGQKIIPENLGYYGASALADYSARSTEDIIRTARKNLVVRDGWANAFYHGFFGVSNLQAIIEGVRALGYTYVPVFPSGKPVITRQPRSQTVLAPSAVKLSVAVIGTESFHYQWQFNGTDVSDATNAVLNFSNPQPTNTGVYTVTITNTWGTTNSVEAALYVLEASPLIDLQPNAGADTLTLLFGTVNGPGYHVEYNDSLNSISWQPLTNVVGNGSVMNVEVSMSAAATRFYRVRVE
jgi:uncharacterized protein YdaL